MAWRLAEALKALRDEINLLSPNRSKVSDGTIGNAEHAARNSDHNPWVMDGKMGVVTAMDITHDPAHGIDSEKLAERLRMGRDPRLKYVISNRKIASADKGWTWRPYDGKNPHNHHVHISVLPSKPLYDSRDPWDTGIKPTVKQATLPVIPPKNPVLVQGNTGPDVDRLQKLLNAKGAKLDPDSNFGGKTTAAVIAFQKAHGLVADGKVGPSTWEALA